MSGKAVDISASGCLVIIFPLAFLIAVLFVAWPLLLALVIAGIGLRIWQRYQWQKWSQQVNPFFHKLIQENQGRITAMDLAIKANLSGVAAKQYLETKVEEFGAISREYPDQGTVYYFLTSSTLGSIFDDSEPPSFYDSDDGEPLIAEQNDDFAEAGFVDIAKAESLPYEPTQLVDNDDSEDDFATQYFQQENLAEAQENLEKPRRSKGIIQSELARRLDVHSSTVLKRKSEPDFSAWSRSRDPEGIAWEYSPKARLFFPQETQAQDS
jgi:hypothetical protein